MTAPLTIPRRLAAHCRALPEHQAWLACLPDRVRELATRWAVTLASPFDTDETSAAWVAPGTRVDGSHVVLKVALPHMEGRDEIAGLRFWNGNPTVRLIEADDGLSAMLIEQCRPGTALRSRPEEEQDTIIASLLHRLWRQPSEGHGFRRLAEMTAFWATETTADRDEWRDDGLVAAGLELLRELPNTGGTAVLLATDLHAGNVLRAQREPWLVIDPKPFDGDPAYDATQHLFNCRPRLLAHPAATIDRFSDLLAVDAERVRLWMFARAAAEPREDWSDPELLSLARKLGP
jgi:streptomycin 6-kinase